MILVTDVHLLLVGDVECLAISIFVDIEVVVATEEVSHLLIIVGLRDTGFQTAIKVEVRVELVFEAAHKTILQLILAAFLNDIF